MPVQTVFIVAAALAVGFGIVWSLLPADVRPPIVVYLGSYLLTYCIGGTWIGLTDGDILTTYFHDRFYIPPIASFGATYWLMLLAPVVVPASVAAAMAAFGDRTPRKAEHRSMGPSCTQFTIIFVALLAYAVYEIFGSGGELVQALSSLATLHGDTAMIIERRIALFGRGTTAAFGIVYSALPALCHVALFKVRESNRWRLIAFTTTAITLAVSLATLQIAPAAVFIGALLVSSTHLRLVHMTKSKAAIFGIGFLFVLQALNGWKFADWTFAENIQHLVFRMPSAFPFYLDCFPATVAFLGTDWVGALIGHGMDPGGPFVVARYMYPTGLAGAMAAPAHVQAYAEGGVLNAMVALVVSGVLVAGVAWLFRRSIDGAIWHALYVQGLVMLYYATQTSFRGLVWHSYGIYWSVLALVAVGVLSMRPARIGTAARGYHETQTDRFRMAIPTH